VAKGEEKTHSDVMEGEERWVSATKKNGREEGRDIEQEVYITERSLANKKESEAHLQENLHWVRIFKTNVRQPKPITPPLRKKHKTNRECPPAKEASPNEKSKVTTNGKQASIIIMKDFNPIKGAQPRELERKCGEGQAVEGG